MAALLFTCPITQMKVQHWLDDDEDASEDDYEGVICQACAGVHFINRKGKVLGGDEELNASSRSGRASPGFFLPGSDSRDRGPRFGVAR
jgi:hypothetical protein